MKQTVNVNIASMAFIMDEDAYNLLKRYLEDVDSRLDSSDVDSLEDIESRIAGIFSEKITSPIQVVNIDMVRRAIALIGKPEAFGARNAKSDYDYQYEPRVKKLYRSENNKMIGGVCSGISEYFTIDVTVLRLAMILLFFLGGVSLGLYIVLWMVIPNRVNYVK